MIKQIFVNLHVKNLNQSRDFYSRLGFTINEQFSDHTGTCIVMGDNIFAMLLTYDKFKRFTPKEISDATKTTEVLNALSVENKDQVNKMVDQVLERTSVPVQVSQIAAGAVHWQEGKHRQQGGQGPNGFISPYF